MPKTAGELARSRTDAARFMTATCDIKRPSTTLSDDGYPSDSETTVASGVSCRIVAKAMNPWESQSGGQVRAVSGYTIMLPYNTDIDPEDVIVSGVRRFEVVGRTEQQTDEVMLLVDAVEIT